MGNAAGQPVCRSDFLASPGPSTHGLCGQQGLVLQVGLDGEYCFMLSLCVHLLIFLVFIIKNMAKYYEIGSAFNLVLGSTWRYKVIFYLYFPRMSCKQDLIKRVMSGDRLRRNKTKCQGQKWGQQM